MTRGLRMPLLLVVGLLLAQAGWLLSVPAFRGLDEFDHVYRAASVARREWLPSGDLPAHGRGELVTVPRDIVTAAGPECRARPYTGPDNCSPADGSSGERVQVASAAARYHPAYYWVVGTAARWSHGTRAVLVMRMVSALLCVLFVALAAWTLSLWARTRWPLAALLGSLTPVLVYSSIVVAPNALEIVAATSTWTALAGLCAAPGRRTERTLLWAAVPGAVVLATVRDLGLGFLALTLLVVAGLLGREGVTGLVRRQRTAVVGAGVVVGVAVADGLAWLLAVPYRFEDHGHYPGAVGGSLIQLPVWVLQTVAAAPGRTNPAPPLVYLLCGGVLIALTVLAWRRTDGRLRVSIAAIAVLSLAGPLAVTLRTYHDVGVVWQGRYGMPFSVGILVLAGLALDRTTRSPTRRTIAVGAAVIAVGQTVAVLHVLGEQRRVSPSIAAGLWSAPSPWLVGGLTVLGWLLLALALAYAGRGSAARGGVARDELTGELLEEQPDVGHDAAGLR